MALIDHIDGPNRLIYLHLDTAGAEVHPVDIYKEMRTLRRNNETLRKYDLFLKADGYVPKGGGKFTAILVTCLLGTRIVPYDSNHLLTITGEIITDEGTAGTDCFDRSSLVNRVDIDYQPPQVEVIEITGGSAVTEQDKDDIRDRVLDANQVDHKLEGTIGASLDDISYTDKWVYVDTESVINGNGKSSTPFNNFPDAVDYAETVGWKRIFLRSDATLDRTLKNFTIEGIGLPTIDFNGQNVDKSEFLKVKLTGLQVGSITAREVVMLSGLTGVNGIYKEFGLAGNIIMANNSISTFASFSTLFTGSPAPFIIDTGIGNTNVILNARKISGALSITNINSATKFITLEFAGGKIDADNTNTIGVLGVAGLPDSAVHIDDATCAKIIEGLFPSKETIADTAWEYLLNAGTDQAQEIIVDILKKAKLAAFKL